MKPIDELDSNGIRAINAMAVTKWSKKTKLAATISGVGTILYGLGMWLPDKLNNWGQFGLTNAAEMSALFAQFNKDDSPENLIKLWLAPEGARKTAMDGWLDGVKWYVGILETIYKTPFGIGDWYKGLTQVGYASAIGQLGNLDTVMQDLEKLGLS